MARPTPIIIPGQGGFGMQEHKSSADLSPLVAMLAGYVEKNQEAKQKAALADTIMKMPSVQGTGITKEALNAMPLETTIGLLAKFADKGFATNMQEQEKQKEVGALTQMYPAYKEDTQPQTPPTPFTLSQVINASPQANAQQTQRQAIPSPFTPEPQAAPLQTRQIAMGNPTREQFQAALNAPEAVKTSFLSKLAPPVNRTLDQQLEAEVQKGNMSLEQAFAMKHVKADPGPNPFNTFYKAEKAKGSSDKQISDKWQKAQAELLQNRIPAFAAEQNLPPDVVRNRRDGKLYKQNFDTGKLEPYKPEKGTSAAEASSVYKADKASLANITKGKDTIFAFEKGVNQSFDLIDKLSDDLTRNKIPGINKVSQFFQYQGGDPRIKAFKNAITTSMTEYMKVTTAGTGISAAELTMGAQQRAKELMESSDNPQMIKQSLKIMRMEMDIKKKAFIEQENEVKGRLKGAPATDASIGNFSTMSNEEILRRLNGE